MFRFNALRKLFGEDTARVTKVKWAAVCTAPDQVVAEMWVGLLRSNGIPARIHPGDSAGFMGVSVGGVRVLVPEGFADTARNIISSIGELPSNEWLS